MMDSEEGCSSSKREMSDSVNIDSFKSYQEPVNNTTSNEYEMEFVNSSFSTHAQNIRRRRHLSPFKPRFKKITNYDHPMPMFSTNEETAKREFSFDHSLPTNRFQKREITTIHEEVFQYKKYKQYSYGINRRAKIKERKDKVSSLKVIISRLKQTYLANPKDLQNNIPEETIQLFKGIHI